MIRGGWFVPLVLCAPIAFAVAPESGLSVEHKGAVIEVTAVSKSAESILQALAAQLSFDLVVRVPPSGIRNVSCKSESLAPLLRCVLGKEVSFMIEAPPADMQAKGLRQRVILLGSRVATPPALSQRERAPAAKVLPDDLREMMGSRSPRRRSEGVYALVSREGLERGQIIDALGLAAQDKDPGVRASALEVLAPFEEASARALVQQGLLDPSGSVRVAALDALAITEASRATFEWALNDPSPAVRDLAGSRLVLLLSAGDP